MLLPPGNDLQGHILTLNISDEGPAVVGIRVEQSRDFQQWEPWQTITSTGQNSLVMKPESDRLFLRAVLLP